MRAEGPPILFVATGLALSALMIIGQYAILDPSPGTVAVADAENPALVLQVAALEQPADPARAHPTAPLDLAAFHAGTH